MSRLKSGVVFKQTVQGPCARGTIERTAVPICYYLEDADPTSQDQDGRPTRNAFQILMSSEMQRILSSHIEGSVCGKVIPLLLKYCIYMYCTSVPSPHRESTDSPMRHAIYCRKYAPFEQMPFPSLTPKFLHRCFPSCKCPISRVFYSLLPSLLKKKKRRGEERAW